MAENNFKKHKEHEVLKKLYEWAISPYKRQVSNIMLFAPLIGCMVLGFMFWQAHTQAEYYKNNYIVKEIQICGDEPVISKDMNVNEFGDFLTKVKMPPMLWAIIIIGVVVLIK